MKRNALAASLAQALFCAVLLPASLSATAQNQAPDAGTAGEPKQLDTVVVQAEIAYRDRTDDIAPTLVYDLEYFQRFEPNTVGDMLKRVPGVGFVGSDIMEYDGVQLRGLGGGYTQVLINGKKVPGAGDDRSFYVDRIPAEMVDHIEIKRSASANRSGDAMAGAINIVLRDAYEFTGSYIRVGVNRWDDGEINPTFGAVTSFEALGGRLLAGINVQDRYRAKTKRSDRFTDDTREEKVSWEDQTEVKDGRDYSANLSYTADVGDTGRFSIDGFYVKTDRDVTEVSFEEELDDDETIDIRVPGRDPYDQKNYGIGAEYRFDMAGGRTAVSIDHARFENDQATTEGEHVYVSGAENWDDTWSIPADAEWDETVYEAESVTAKDAETGFRLTHARPLGGAELEFGVDYRTKKREGLLVTYEWEAEEEGQTPASLADYDLDGSVASVIEEKRLDPYIMLSGKGDAFSWEAGLRYETTKSEVEYLEDDESEGRVSKDYNELLPSVNLRWNLGEADRISLSLAKTIKRPNFNELLPALLDGEFGDNDYIGNPELDPETANGLDLGFEHRLGRKGVVGVNFFYRDVKDLIEIVNTGVPSEEMQDTWEEMIEDGDAVDLADAMAQEPASSWLYTSDNVGDGKVYGFEFDVSTPLSAIGLENTGIFANYSWVKSKVDDFLGERRFNDQAKSVYNIGFIHDMPTLGASFGATYRKQGDAYARLLGEEALIRYGGELDVFVEKRFGANVSVRLSANNLLDASKDEFFDKFDTQQDQIDRDYDEYELETEEAGPSYQLVMRWAF
ncbi:TonB-dependent receptor [Pseudoxanthomonas sp. F37]|jgi:TonB-dependent receptor|uniref:TonB-dependent receptor plug domain-containing protein n=1 Tax=Pseudoxanthomonas TaxID=83618 RepID=UPI001FD0770F|nr:MULTISPECIES: TonB-dependent receptor [Pseudoxanthomonas]UOV04762.1 TonB-dependent receptor [Pseudoxanthomonas mexicana]UOV09774.1 TonB-dependent receptor [Pseudoxanthomonas sp. F37]